MESEELTTHICSLQAVADIMCLLRHFCVDPSQSKYHFIYTRFIQITLSRRLPEWISLLPFIITELGTHYTHAKTRDSEGWWQKWKTSMSSWQSRTHHRNGSRRKSTVIDVCGTRSSRQPVRHEHETIRGHLLCKLLL